MNAPTTLVMAMNQNGFNVERHTGGRSGWVSVRAQPFSTRTQAEQYMEEMYKFPGVEYRVYASLVKR